MRFITGCFNIQKFNKILPAEHNSYLTYTNLSTLWTYKACINNFFCGKTTWQSSIFLPYFLPLQLFTAVLQDFFTPPRPGWYAMTWLHGLNLRQYRPCMNKRLTGQLPFFPSAGSAHNQCPLNQILPIRMDSQPRGHRISVPGHAGSASVQTRSRYPFLPHCRRHTSRRAE